MKKNMVQLRQEVFESDAWKIIDWMKDIEVIKYLNEKQNVGEAIKRLIYRINMPVLTHLFNQNGSFFIVTDKEEPIGFLKLVPKGKNAEMVVVIGERKKWGSGLGTNAIFQGLKHAFFVLRVNEVIATIHLKNERSINAFKRIGFKKDRELKKETKYSISMDEFLKLA